MTGFSDDFSAVLCLNNRTGDGHDISWIESTDYEKLVADPHLKKIYVGGDCMDQLYARLKKAAGKRKPPEKKRTQYHKAPPPDGTGTEFRA